MSENIVEILKQHQLRSLARSENATRIQEQRVTNKANCVRGMLGGTGDVDGVPMELVLLRNLYYSMLESFRGSRSSVPVKMNDKSIAFWTRVEKARQRAECSAEEYLLAQFKWFDKAFGAAPKLPQLTTPLAIQRAIEFEGRSDGRVIGNGKIADIDRVEVFKETEKLLQQIMKAQKCSREDVYRRFVLTGLYTFPKEFMDFDPAYKKALQN